MHSSCPFFDRFCKDAFFFMGVQETLEHSRNEITAALMKTLPKLLRKYLADKAKIPHIVELVMHMNLEQFNLKRQEQVSTILYCHVLFINV